MDAARNVPRIVIAATGSGVGKTTAAAALIGALRARGLKVAPFKCGPDYLDPTYHRLAAGRPSHNLDGWMMGREAVAATFTRAADGADIAVIEGMMGLFDSAAPDSEEGSAAEIAKWLGAPVLLVADASGVARTIAAIAAGFKRFDPAVNVAGLICNRAGSRGHLDLLRAAKPEVPIVGGFPARPDIAFPERHLGLIRARADDAARIAQWSRIAAEWFDLDAILAIARAAPPLENAPAPIAAPARPCCRIGVAFDDAFHFYYEDNLARLRALGAEIVSFSPCRDRAIPEVDGLCFGGGYPEAHAEELASNGAMLDAIRKFAARGGVVYAECGGLMYLSEGIRTLDGKLTPMAGLVPGVAAMSDRMRALGYVEVETRAESILGPAGARFRGHQFRYSALEACPELSRSPERSERGSRRRAGQGIEEIYRVAPRWGGAPFAEGYRRGNVLASYVHAHWASNPSIAEALVRSCVNSRAR